MNKNTIIQMVIDKLLNQRNTLIVELTELNYNEASALDKRAAIEMQIANIDVQINSRIVDCELTQP